ncbi:MFS transporter [Aeromonas sp. OTU364]|uniref:MFS transporter n=1 Tax=Aeromonas sp. OTU364 TaxID=3043864 RepID=UPI00313C7784
MNDIESISVHQAVKTAKVSSFHIYILLLCLSILILDGFDTALMGYVAPAIIEQWGIAKADLGLAMSAALIGLALGAIVSGPVSDRLGRKPIIVLSVIVFGVCCIATTQASNVNQLVFWRLCTGIGIGAAMSNALTIISEFAPERYKSLMVNAVFCGFPFGAALSGVLASWLIPNLGWHSVFIFGGMLPLLLLVPIIRTLPESILFQLSQPGAESKIRKTARRLLGEMRVNLSVSPTPVSDSATTPIRDILSPSMLPATLLLWLAYFMGLLIFYVVTSWMPTLIGEAGYDLQHAAFLTALFPLGGAVGTIVSGLLMDKVTPHKIVAFNYFMTGLFLFSISFVSDIYLLGLFILLAGTVMNGAQASMGSIATLHYPTSSRATGVSWMLGMGRAGGIVGAMIGAWLFQFGLDYKGIFKVLLIPSLFAALALLGLMLTLKWKKRRLSESALTESEACL